MAPAAPFTRTAGSNPILKVEKAFEVTVHEPPFGRNFYFNCKIDPRNRHLLKLEAAGMKPPAHFHPRSWEYMKVVKGILTIEVDGTPQEVTAADGEFTVPPGTHHCLYATSDQAPEVDVVEFWLSAKATEEVYSRLDLAFFENWYGYQEEILLRNAKPDLIQILSIFDAGDSYLSLPPWIPFRSSIAYWLGVVIGRWIGGVLGYQPFYSDWTTDWDTACRKMKRHLTQRRFASK